MDRPAGAVANLARVAAVVATDRVGARLASSGELDGAAVGAMHAFAWDLPERCGDALGLGTLHRIPIAGAHYGWALEFELGMARGR